MRILIVEDEVKIRHGISALITKISGHEIVGEAKNGVEGIELIQRENPDVVITDIKMPQMDGLEMIKNLRQLGLKTHCVILSGYSEFDYAKQAIEYGVDSYLIKPLAPEDIVNLLNELDEKVKNEKQDYDVSLQSLFSKLIEDGLDEVHSNEILKQLCRKGYREDEKYILLAGYGYDSSAQGKIEACNKVNGINQLGFTFLDEKNNQILSLMPQIDTKEVLQNLDYYFGKTKKQIAWVISRAYLLKDMSKAYKEVEDLFVYSQLANGCSVISSEYISKMHFEEYVYPVEIVSKVKAAVFKSDTEAIEAAIKEFHEHAKQKLYYPNQLMDGQVKLIKKVTGYLEENDAKFAELFTAKNIDKMITTSRTLFELNNIMNVILAECHSVMDYKEDVSNYALKRAIAYIRTHYQEQISLESIAGMLEITPEYLSVLFSREMGMNFSVFLRDFRISHAKRLLKSTELKIYEVAEQTGYPNTKYFNRVFRETVGCSPKEYRQM